MRRVLNVLQRLDDRFVVSSPPPDPQVPVASKARPEGDEFLRVRSDMMTTFSAMWAFGLILLPVTLLVVYSISPVWVGITTELVAFALVAGCQVELRRRTFVSFSENGVVLSRWWKTVAWPLQEISSLDGYGSTHSVGGATHPCVRIVTRSMARVSLAPTARLSQEARDVLNADITTWCSAHRVPLDLRALGPRSERRRRLPESDASRSVPAYADHEAGPGRE